MDFPIVSKVTNSVRLALLQLNFTVGDLVGNRDLILEGALEAHGRGAELAICTELAICAYPPKDYLLRDGFVAACDRAVEELASLLPADMGLIVGHPTWWNVNGTYPANAASLLHGGKVVATVHKTLLPNYDVFDERRYFASAESVSPMEFRGLKLGVHICEDAWYGEPETNYHLGNTPQTDPVAALGEQGVDLLINISASPFEVEKLERRIGLARRHVAKFGKPFVFVNQIGGHDDLVFDGQSFVLNAQGTTALVMSRFATAVEILDTDQLPTMHTPRESYPREADLLDAVMLGLRDYARKTGFTDCVLGLSGGVDSALAAYIAAQAVGPEHVHGLMMPSRHSSDHSIIDAQKLADNLGLDAHLIKIDEIHQAYEGAQVVSEDLSSNPGGLADQNLQARIRGALVMIRSNRHNWLALATGNKSELAVGYCTLYGDMAGGFAVLSDLFKKDVYAVCEYVNKVREGKPVIPENILTKPPSAELAPNQFDQDSLPPYPILDGILEALIEDDASAEDLYEDFDPQIVQWVLRKLDQNEFKRRQMPPGIKLTPKAFGVGRRMPMAAKYRLG